MRPEAHQHERQRGLSLVEVMVSMAVGLLLLGGAVAVYVQTKESYHQNEQVAQMQDDARFALEELGRDIAAAAFWGEMLDAGNITRDTSLSLVDDCGSAGAPDWVYDVTTPFTTLDNATGADAQAAHACIDGAVFRPGTDLVAVKRVAGATAAALLPGGVYLRTNGTIGLLFEHPAAAPPALVVPAPFNDWEYAPAIYYVRTHANERDAGDGVPTLCRKYLDTRDRPTVAEECLARGVEDLQIEFGLDTDADGQVDSYVPDPDPAELQRVISVKLFLLARSADPDPGYTNDKTYRYSNGAAFAPGDSFYRRLYTMTVLVRNIGNQVAFGS